MSDETTDHPSAAPDLSRRRLLVAGGLGFATATTLDTLVSPSPAAASVLRPQTPLPGANIPKYVESLPTFSGKRVRASSMTTAFVEFAQHVLPPSMYPSAYAEGTWVWGYQVAGRPASWPGYTVEAWSGRPTTVRYVNKLPGVDGGSRVAPLLTVDQTIHWADPLNRMDSTRPYRGPFPAVAHLHGGEVHSGADGGPQGWFTADGRRGPGYESFGPGAPNEAVYRYPNAQPSCTLWFHDHALGITRLNVYAGLAAFYLVRDRYDTGRPDNPLRLPADPYEIEIAIQDRQFDTDGQLLFPDSAASGGLVGGPPNQAAHPYWIPAFQGDAMVVNGRTWPVLAVEPRRYRFRVLNGCNGRYLSMNLTEAHNADLSCAPSAAAFWQIGTDGGLLDRPAELNTPGRPEAKRLDLAPAERADLIIDFSGLDGCSLILTNNAVHSFPTGTLPDPALDGQIMRIDVCLPLSGRDATYDPATGEPLRGGPGRPAPIARLADPDRGEVSPGVRVDAKRQLMLSEQDTRACAIPPEVGGTLIALVNNSSFTGLRSGTETPVSGSRPDAYGQGLWLTERPRVGSTEVWEILNASMFAHPMHIHLIQFQLVGRQKVDAEAYLAAWGAQFPGGTFEGQKCDGTLGEVRYEPGVIIPGYGSPRDYLTPNHDAALGGNPAFGPYLQGPVMPPEPNEAGWKDTVNAQPGQVTRVIARWAPTETPVGGVVPGENLFPFDPTRGPGYVWHCHIIDHEDNEMMRPYAPTR
ncbi:multicopper oxidase domain-containing protein [Actinospica durhamensis]|uniref:Multicopper oxidase domain-containing protein n=1 Tax=Actinospica durhamensis TaxID=1508375 RepID=A0A941EM08_9ACTN|nr:multicopper oxidase domain-containing protein [Actinospica durhamensis]MBR7833601.1 multicopper oxidase domain-containing protein [Actinospica durhamensis]